jgi:hypothetical protein
MSELAQTAGRFDSNDDIALIDYFPVHLPVQLLTVDVVGIERRSIPAITEFCLKAIDAGLQDTPSIGGFLGVDPEYLAKLLTSLLRNEHVNRDAFGRFVLQRRGKELLRQGSEDLPSDRRMQILWDPVQKIVLDRTLVYTKQRADRAGILAPMPGAFARPDVSVLNAAEINKVRLGNATLLPSEGGSFEVLRVTSIYKSLGRYRNALGLVQKSTDGELSLRLVVGGSIDNDLTAAYAQAGLAKLIGVRANVANKPGVQAVRKRQNELVCGESKNSNVGKLVQRRSVLLLNLSAVDARLAEEHVDALIEKQRNYNDELGRISDQLSRLPVMPIRCYEPEYYAKLALRSAMSSITITTTNPSSAKTDGEILGCIRSCLNRGVDVRIYISDRLGENDPTLASLDRLSRENNLNVRFLQNDMRSVFEIEWDKKGLLVSNEPVLGERRRPISPREFTGFYVSDPEAIEQYCTKHLTFQSDDFLVRIKAVAGASGAAASQKKAAGDRSARRG